MDDRTPSVAWYAVGMFSCDPLISKISGEPYIAMWPDRETAEAWCERCFPEQAVRPMSVMEYDAMREMQSAQARFLKADDEHRAIAIAREEIQRAIETGQGELMTSPVCWYERRVA